MKARVAVVRFVGKHISWRAGSRLRNRLPESERVFDTRVSLHGVQLEVNTGAAPGCTLYWRGHYEPHEIAVFMDLVSSVRLVFDIGANVGIYSLLAAQAGARVVAFEPSRRMQQRLHRNVGLNGAEGQIEIVPFAVANQRGSVDFYEGRATAWGVGKIFSYGLTDGSDGMYSVETTTIDYFVGQRGLPDLIKIDIEGAEWFAIQGARHTLARPDAPLLLLEFHPGEIEELGGRLEICLEWLADAGYMGYRIVGQEEAVSSIDRHRLVFCKTALSLPGLASI